MKDQNTIWRRINIEVISDRQHTRQQTTSWEEIQKRSGRTAMMLPESRTTGQLLPNDTMNRTTDRTCTQKNNNRTFENHDHTNFIMMTNDMELSRRPSRKKKQSLGVASLTFHSTKKRATQQIRFSHPEWTISTVFLDAYTGSREEMVICQRTGLKFLIPYRKVSR